MKRKKIAPKLRWKKLHTWRHKKLLIGTLGAVFVFTSLYVFFASYREDEQAITLIDGISIENQDKIALEAEIRKIVQGYPIEEMVPYIVEKDPQVAAFLVSIAKKESNWGKRVPVLNGEDCYNYWGFRAGRKRMGTGGHTCFDNPRDAVDTVAARIENLVESDVDTPREMIVWKCGSNCAGHEPGSVQKWISDVNLFFKKLYPVNKGS